MGKTQRKLLSTFNDLFSDAIRKYESTHFLPNSLTEEFNPTVAELKPLALACYRTTFLMDGRSHPYFLSLSTNDTQAFIKAVEKEVELTANELTEGSENENLRDEVFVTAGEISPKVAEENTFERFYKDEKDELKHSIPLLDGPNKEGFLAGIARRFGFRR